MTVQALPLHVDYMCVIVNQSIHVRAMSMRCFNCRCDMACICQWWIHRQFCRGGDPDLQWHRGGDPNLQNHIARACDTAAKVITVPDENNRDPVSSMQTP
jgi:hypothetical protein